MIGTIIAAVAIAVGGYAVGRTRSLQREEELRAQVMQARHRSLPKILPAGRAPVATFLEAHRNPAPTSIVALPVDREDFELLTEAVCECLAALVANRTEGKTVAAGELRDALLHAIYPDFAWPPVPGDHSSALLMWTVADYESRRVLALASCPTHAFGSAAMTSPSATRVG